AATIAGLPRRFTFGVRRRRAHTAHNIGNALYSLLAHPFVPANARMEDRDPSNRYCQATGY
ncbi:MAG TPA: hypothetical protein VFN07_09175, partial [Trueperaceae bacterium]|nr:hypothetical protein [Trueperaceae bacterium]